MEIAMREDTDKRSYKYNAKGRKMYKSATLIQKGTLVFNLCIQEGSSQPRGDR